MQKIFFLKDLSLQCSEKIPDIFQRARILATPSAESRKPLFFIYRPVKDRQQAKKKRDPLEVFKYIRNGYLPAEIGVRPIFFVGTAGRLGKLSSLKRLNPSAARSLLCYICRRDIHFFILLAPRFHPSKTFFHRSSFSVWMNIGEMLRLGYTQMAYHLK